MEPIPVDSRVELLSSIEERWVDARFNDEYASIAQLEQALTELETQGSADLERTRLYWLSLVVLTAVSNNFESTYDDGLLPTIDWVVEIMSSHDQPNSDELALLTLAHSLKLQHVAGSELFGAIQDQRRRVAEIQQQHASNPRVLLICAISDLIEPVGFGGGAAAASLLEKAAGSGEFESELDAFGPTWGRAEAAIRLVGLLIDRRRFLDAEKIWRQAVEQFDDHPALHNLDKRYKDFVDFELLR